jgi:hypothetical protein
MAWCLEGYRPRTVTVWHHNILRYCGMTKISLVVFLYSEMTPNASMICAMLDARYGLQELSALASQVLSFL